MYCKNCGTKIEDGVKFCPNCGTNVQEEVAPMATEAAASSVSVEEKPPKVWSVFALVSKILGIVCLIVSFIPIVDYLSFFGSIAGIVLACLGKNAKDEESEKNSSLGLKLSIAALVISFVLMILYIAIIIELE